MRTKSTSTSYSIIILPNRSNERYEIKKRIWTNATIENNA